MLSESTGNVHQGGEKVSGLNDTVVLCLGLSDAGPVENKGHPRAAFIKRIVSLATVERRVLEIAALVGKKDNDSIFFDTLFLKRISHTPHRLVNGFDHGRIVRISSGQTLGLEMLYPILPPLMRAMYGIVPEREHEGLVSVILLDEVDGFVGQPVCKIAFFFVGHNV